MSGSQHCGLCIILQCPAWGRRLPRASVLLVGEMNDSFPACFPPLGSDTPAIRGRHLQLSKSRTSVGGLRIPADFSQVFSFLSSACTQRQGWQFRPLCPLVWHVLKMNSWCEEGNPFRPSVQPSHEPWDTVVNHPINIY